jgi:hypothetical protein
VEDGARLGGVDPYRTCLARWRGIRLASWVAGRRDGPGVAFGHARSAL